MLLRDPRTNSVADALAALRKLARPPYARSPIPTINRLLADERVVAAISMRRSAGQATGGSAIGMARAGEGAGAGITDGSALVQTILVALTASGFRVPRSLLRVAFRTDVDLSLAASRMQAVDVPCMLATAWWRRRGVVLARALEMQKR